MTVVEDIKGRLDILEVVSHYVPLQRSGRSYKANCPFHQEKTPSFYVFPERQTWRCFGACATGGDVFSFVMRVENLEFAEALKRLAQQAGVALPDRERRSEQQAIFQINEMAREYFQGLLGSSQGAAARNYLEGRGLTPQWIEKFELGLSPWDGVSLKDYLVQQSFSAEQLALAGVVRSGENGQYRDLFRGRLMIPIRNVQGELAGFGGRSLDDSNPKYLNSPRSPCFDKGRLLYALHLARESARRQGVVIVEGYMDAIMAHQHGFSNVVASMGTALTEHQVSEIRRLTGDITMALDPDAAGQQATLRSLETSWQVFQTRVVGNARGTAIYQRQDPPVLKIAVLPGGMDPDEVIRQSPEQWGRLVEGAIPLLEYLFTTLSGQIDLSTAQGKARLAELMFPLITAIPQPAQQDHYFQVLAAHLGVSEETLRASMEGYRTPRRSRSVASPVRVATPSAFASLDYDPVENYCLALLLQHPELLTAVEDLRLEHFRRWENREIFSHWIKLPQDVQGMEVLGFLRQDLDSELGEHLESLVHKTLPPLEHSRWSLALQETVRRLEERYLRELKAEEGLKFSEVPPDSLAGPYEEALDLNQRLKDNENKRHGTSESVSRRR